MNGFSGRRSLRALAAVGALAALLALAPEGEERDEKPRLAPGRWGGNHVGIEVTDTVARLEFDCAHGTIEGPIPLEKDGRFRAAGTFEREYPGPVRQGESPPRLRATYEGSTDGQTMTLNVTLSDDGKGIGSFTLALGRPPRIHKCL